MINYIVFNEASGEIWQAGGAQDAESVPLQDGQALMVIDDAVLPSRATHYVNDGELIAYSEAGRAVKATWPGYQEAVWSNASMSWEDTRTLLVLREHKRAEVNEARRAADLGVFSFAGKLIACDAVSRLDIGAINGEVALTGALPADFAGSWRAVDNSVVSIPDVAVWTAFYKAMTAHGAANYRHLQALKAAIDKADMSSLKLIAW